MCTLSKVKVYGLLLLTPDMNILTQLAVKYFVYN